mmetsp:Transcript_26851/g.67850  ORF Transcript_26851/g.67850 Transcript_26851/m.67850 type:complete len:228 (+) Transcript_26851:1064-1747(+)
MPRAPALAAQPLPPALLRHRYPSLVSERGFRGQWAQLRRACLAPHRRRGLPGARFADAGKLLCVAPRGGKALWPTLRVGWGRSDILLQDLLAGLRRTDRQLVVGRLGIGAPLNRQRAALSSFLVLLAFGTNSLADATVGGSPGLRWPGRHKRRLVLLLLQLPGHMGSRGPVGVAALGRNVVLLGTLRQGLQPATVAPIAAKAKRLSHELVLAPRQECGVARRERWQR